MNFVFALFSITISAVIGVLGSVFTFVFLVEGVNTPVWFGGIMGFCVLIAGFIGVFNTLREYFKF